MPRSDTQFKPGNLGRKPGSRKKLSEAFLKAMSDDFNEHGIEAIVEVREKRPADYVRVVASLLPKDVKLETGQFTLVDVLQHMNEGAEV